MMIKKPKYRSSVFHAYLEQQTPERRRELIAAETAFEDERRAREKTDGIDPAERDGLEGMYGYEDRPAGPDQIVDINQIG